MQAGMLVLSIVADRLGRRLGSITTASIMFCGGILMTLAPPFWGLNTMFLIFTISYGLYGMCRATLVLLFSSLRVPMPRRLVTVPGAEL